MSENAPYQAGKDMGRMEKRLEDLEQSSAMLRAIMFGSGEGDYGIKKTVDALATLNFGDGKAEPGTKAVIKTLTTQVIELKKVVIDLQDRLASPNPVPDPDDTPKVSPQSMPEPGPEPVPKKKK